MKEKIEASIMFASYFETIGFKNSIWEFNYNINITSLDSYLAIWTTLSQEFIILGGSNNINIKNWNSSDDTILIISIIKSILDGGGQKNYIENFVDSYKLLYDNKRGSGINTLETIKLLKQKISIRIKSTMGGNGAALRTGPIGIYWYNNIEKVIEEAIISSILTHNYYIGFLGGMITALFTAFAINNIPPWLWIKELLKLYNDKIIHKYYPKFHNIEDLDKYINYWKKYDESRLSKIKYKNSLDIFLFAGDRITQLLEYNPDPKIQELILSGQNLKKLDYGWNNIASTGIDACIYSYDCLLMSMFTPNSKILDFNNIQYNIDTFIFLIAIHPGDNDTTGAIGGTWFGALNGYNNFNKNRLLELEFYTEIKTLSDRINKKLI
jgi:ADP-ribosylarginine hydrolase